MLAARLAIIALGTAGLISAADGDWVGRPLISAYASADVGRDDTLWCAVRDARGAMHFGGKGMLNFDGQTWTHTSAGGATQVRGLAVSGDGRIYAAASGELGWFDYFAERGWTYHSLAGALPADDREVGDLWSVFSVPGGGAVFVGAHALYWWDGRAFSVQNIPGAQRISAMQASGRLLVDDRRTGLWQYERDRRQLLVPGDGLAGAAIVWAEVSADGRSALLATTRGFFRRAGARLTPAFPGGSELVRRFGLSAVATLSDGRLALGTMRAGVAFLDGQGAVLQTFGRREGLPTDEILGLFADGGGGLWAMSSANAVRISLNPIRFFRSDGDSGDHPTVIIDRMAGRLADITDAGDVLVQNQPDRFSLDYGLYRHCWCALSVPAGLLVARLGGIDRIGPRGAEAIFRRGGTFSALASGREAGVLLAAIDRAIYRIHLGNQTAESVISHLPAPATSVLEDAGGTVWMGTTGRGIFKARPEAHYAVEAQTNWGGDEGHGLVAQSAGRGFAFTVEGGWGRTGVDSFRAIERFPRRATSAVAFTEAGEPWLIHPDEDGTGPCLARIVCSVAGDRQAMAWQPWPIEGLWRVGVPECLHVEGIGPLRRIWIGGTAGVLDVQIDLRQPPRLPPRPRLVLLEQSEGAVSLHADTDRLALGPALAVETWVQGVDGGWLRDGAANRRLAALRPGRYLVRARVVDAAGDYGPEAAAAFEVPAPWWRRPWAMSAWAALVLGAAALWHRTRSAVLRIRAADLETKVRERTAELERVTAEKSRLVAGISHDIRNPLNGLIGIALALEDTELGARQRELLQAMRACAAHVSGMMEDVIDFARLETGRAEARPGPCAPRAILEDAVALVRHDADAAGACVRMIVAPSVPEAAMVDATRVRQILVNFLGNAVKFAGGEIDAGLDLSASGGEMVFSVADRGPGIAPADRQRLFQPFERLRETLPGAGLGLATSKRWAELMGGRIQVTTEVGKGCRFELHVPCLPVPEASEQPADARWKVLLVEDEDYSAWATTAVAARMGLTVHERARTAAEALKLVGQRPFDVVLLDQRLPDGEGRVVCERLRRTAKGRQPMVVAISGAAADRSWHAAGADAFVPKPVTPEKLGSALAAATRLRTLRFLSDGTPEGFKREAQRYRAQLREFIGALETALGSGVAADVRSAAHRLEGHFRMLNAAAGVAACGDLEREPGIGEPMERIAAAAEELEKLLG